MIGLAWPGADTLAELVCRYWHRQGFSDIKVWAELVHGGREPLVVIQIAPGDPAACPPS